MIPIPTEVVPFIPVASFIQVGVSKKCTFDENGNRFTKKLTTNDASYRPPEGFPVNNLMDLAVSNDFFWSIFTAYSSSYPIDYI